MNSDFERVLPHDLDAERSVLGAVLVNETVFPDVAALLQPGDFFRDGHRKVFSAMQTIYAKSRAIDFMTLRDALEAGGHLADAGGPAYITALPDGMPFSSHADDYARIVKDHSLRRQAIFAATQLSTDAYERDSVPADVLQRGIQTLLRVSEQAVRGGLVDMPTLMPKIVQTLEERHAKRATVIGVPSGFPDLDDLTCGFQPGELVILAARPGMGKSALGLNIAQHAAIDGGRSVAVFSLEMSEVALGMRLLASEARIDAGRLKRGLVADREWPVLSSAMARIADSRLRIDESADVTVFDIRSRMRRLHREHGLDLIIIDYLQLMRPTDRGENRNLELAAISRALKVIAKDLQVPILCLSQLSRDCEKRAEKRPMLSDLRDSGAIEQDADVVLFIYRDEVYNTRPDNPNRGIAEIIIGKQRDGQTGTVTLRWLEHLTRFDDSRSEA